MDLLRSLPIGLYLERPRGWLHRLDARVKLGWLMSFLLTPLVANTTWRIVLVVLLVAIALSSRIPVRIWRKQVGWLVLFCAMLFCVGAIAPDGLSDRHQQRLPENALDFDRAPVELAPEPDRAPWYAPFTFGRTAEPDAEPDAEPNAEPNRENTATPPTVAPDLPQPGRYRYVLFQEGPLTITRRSLDLAIYLSTLVFTLLFSTNLFLLTTAPEAITAGLEDLMRPLRRFNVPVTELALTLTLSLRFLPLVLEEIQNLVRSIQTRAIDWRKLGFWGGVKTGLIVIDRLLENLLLRAEQISGAMAVRGFTAPDTHRVLWHESKLRKLDWLALAIAIGLWGVRIVWGGQP